MSHMTYLAAGLQACLAQSIPFSVPCLLRVLGGMLFCLNSESLKRFFCTFPLQESASIFHFNLFYDANHGLMEMFHSNLNGLMISSMSSFHFDGRNRLRIS